MNLKRKVTILVFLLFCSMNLLSCSKDSESLTKQPVETVTMNSSDKNQTNRTSSTLRPIEETNDVKSDQTKSIHIISLQSSAGNIEIDLDKKVDEGILSNLNKEELYYIRNGYFAKYGYDFSTEKYKSFFLKYSWYKPLYKDVDSKLSNIDAENIEIVKKYENLTAQTSNVVPTPTYTPVPSSNTKITSEIPTYVTNSNTFTYKDFIATNNYTKYQSTNVAKDLSDSKGPLSDTYWERVYYLMGYNADMIPKKMELWREDNGSLNYIFPSGKIICSADSIYALFIVNNMNNSSLKNWFYSSTTSPFENLKAHIVANGTEEAKKFVKLKDDENIKRQELWNDYWKNKNK